jgi:hypothetical protein
MTISNKEYCTARGCAGEAILVAIDNFAGISSRISAIRQRKPLPACRKHVALWLRQAGDSFWWFPLGDHEADSLTTEQVIDVLRSPEEVECPACESTNLNEDGSICWDCDASGYTSDW